MSLWCHSSNICNHSVWRGQHASMTMLWLSFGLVEPHCHIYITLWLSWWLILKHNSIDYLVETGNKQQPLENCWPVRSSWPPLCADFLCFLITLLTSSVARRFSHLNVNICCSRGNLLKRLILPFRCLHFFWCWKLKAPHQTEFLILKSRALWAHHKEAKSSFFILHLTWANKSCTVNAFKERFI